MESPAPNLHPAIPHVDFSVFTGLTRFLSQTNWDSHFGPKAIPRHGQPGRRTSIVQGGPDTPRGRQKR